MSQFNSKFYDFFTHPDDLNVMVKGAKEYGFSGIVVTNPVINEKAILPNDFSIYKGVLIQAKPSRIREEIKKFRNSNLISIVRGGEEEINRACVESAGLDILLQPAEFNNVLAKAASDHSIAIGFNLGLLIRLRGDMRIRELKYMRINLKHARKYKLQMLLTNDPASVFEIRSPREMVALSGLFGMTQSEAIEAISSTPRGILRRKSPQYIQEGIEVI